MVDLILKDIRDPHVRENFFRIQNFIKNQVLFEGDFKLFDITIDKKVDSFKVKHGLTFIPADIVVVSVDGDFNYYFRFKDFDKDFIYITTNGPVRLRFLAGKLKNPLGAVSGNSFPIVPPGDITALHAEVETHLNTLRILSSGIYLIESMREVRILSGSSGESTIVQGALEVKTSGMTVVETGATMRVTGS